MKRISVRLGLLGLGLVSILASSCSQLSEISDAKLAPFTSVWAIPIIDDTLRTTDLVAKRVEDGSLKPNANGVYYFAFENSVSSPPAGDIVPVPDATSSTDLIGAVTGTVYTVQGSYNLTDNKGFHFYLLRLKEGIIGVSGNCNFGNDFNYTLKFPKIVTPTGQALTLNGTYNSASRTFNSAANSLINCNVDLQGTGAQYNIVPYEITITFTNGFSATSPSQNLHLDLSITNMKFKYAEMSTDKAEISPIQNVEIPIKIFDKKYREERNNINLEDPKLIINVFNSTGASANINVTNLRSFTPDVPAEDKYLLGSGVTGLRNLEVDAATYTRPWPVSIVPNYVVASTINRSNTNITDIVNFFQLAPQRIGFDVKASLASDTNTRVFLIDTATVKVNLTAIIPCDGNVTRYVLSDTTAFNVPLSNSTSSVKNLELKLTMNNQFPTNLNGQLYFVDSLYRNVDSVASPLIPGGPIDYVLAKGSLPSTSDFRVLDKDIAESSRIFNIDSVRYNKIQKNVKFIILRAIISTPGATSSPPARCRIYDYYTIRMRLGLKATVDNKF